MAEIKSAIELAMERTRNLVMDDEEKKESLRKETEQKVRAVLRRYVEGMIDEDGVDGELEEIKADRGTKKKLLMTLLFEDFDITAENGRIIDLFRHEGSGLPGSLITELDSMGKEFSRALEKRKGAISERVVKRLEGIGITGDGVTPNVEAWEEWEDAREDTGRVFGAELGEWKKKLAAALDKA